MELPLGGPALRHYTQSRPRPHRQKLNYRPSKPQETIIESENEVLELIGRVDEGVEEFFTKKVLPADTQKKEDEESITVHEAAPASSVPCPPPGKTLRRKLGDFFTLRKRRGLKSESSQEGRPKKASIADLIRPLREAARADKEKDKDRVKEHDKEKEKENPSAVPGESADQETPVSGAPALRGEAVPPRRALREGKSQSLILLSGSSAAGTTNARKKQFEGQHSFEQKLHLMLQRIGVSKAPPGDTQNPEREMKKAESEGTIIDSKTDPPPTKPRTMSASSDTRYQIRPSVSAHESTGKPALLPKPVIKPPPGSTASGRSTPENELGHMREGDTHAGASVSAASPGLSAPSGQTISDSNSTDVTSSPPSTVTPVSSDTCADPTNSKAAAVTPTNVTEVDSKAAAADSTATDLPTSTSQTTSASPAEHPVTSTTSESITLNLSVTSNSPTNTAATSTIAIETVSAPNSENSVPTPAAADLLAQSSVEAASAAVVVAASSICTTVSDTIPSDSPPVPTTTTTTSSAAVAPDALTSGFVASSSTVTKLTSLPPNSSDTDTAPVSSDAAAASSSTHGSAAPPTTSTAASAPVTTTSPTSTRSMHPAPAVTTDVSVPSTPPSETNPTDSTTTAAKAGVAAISSPLTADSVPPPSNTAGSLLPSIVSSFPVTDDESVTPHHATSGPSHSEDSPGQVNGLQTHPEERASLAPTAPDTAHEETVVKLAQKSEQAEEHESEKAEDALSEKRNCEERATAVDSEVSRKEAQEEKVKLEEVRRTTREGTSEPASAKADVLFGTEPLAECQNVKSGDEK